MINRKNLTLENRIARLEKLLVKNESLPRSGMKLGQILALYTGNDPDNFGRVIKDLEMTDTLYFIADAAGLDESDAAEYIEGIWDEPCMVRVNNGAGGGGSDEVTVMVDGISFDLDWLDEAYESRNRRPSRTHRR